MNTKCDEFDNWPVKPMEPVSCDKPFDSADTLFQIKWDGVRVLAYVYPDNSIRLFNRRLNERTAQYPELVAALNGLCGCTVLDGEIIVPGKDGKPDFPRVLKRDLCRSPQKIAAAARSIGINYMVFDVLWFAGKPVYPLPLTERLEMLNSISFSNNIIHIVESIPESGRALFDAVKSEGLEGIVAKNAQSSYRIGKKTDAWQKIKCLRELTAVIGGYLSDNGRPRSLLLGLPSENGLMFIGAAACGITQSQWKMLIQLFADTIGPCPFEDLPDMKDARFVAPLLGVNVRFLEFSPGGVMRSPSITGFTEGFI